MVVHAAAILLTAIAPFLPQDPEPGPAESVPQEQQERSYDLPRGLIFGEVTDSAGDPWVGVTVHLVARPLPDVNLGTGDRLTATTDERGRFRADAIHGWRYHVWAEAAPDGDGVYRRSPVATGRVGAPLELREGPSSCLRIVEVSNTEPWAEDGAFTWEIEGHAGCVLRQGDLAADGTIPVPPMPGGHATVRVRSGRGVVVGTQRVDLSRQGEVQMRLNEARLVQVRMYEEGMKKPLKVGEVVVADDWQRQVLAELDEKGRAEFRVPVASTDQDVQSWSYRIRAPGFCAGFMAAPQMAYDDADAKRVLEAGGVVMHGGLSKGTRVKGRLLLPGGEPLVGATLMMECEAHGQVEESHFYGGDSRWLATTDAEGRFVGAHFYGSGGGVVRVLLTPEMMARLPAEWQRGLQPWVLLASVSAAKQEQDLGDIEFAKALWPADIFLETPEGLPAASAELYFDLGSTSNYHREWFAVDRLGRTRLLLPRSGSIRLAVAHATGVAVELFDVDVAAQAIPSALRWPIRLRTPLKVRGRIVDANGLPVANASVHATVDYNSNVQRLEGGEDPVRLGPVTLVPKELERQQGFGLLAAVISKSSRKTATDEEGRFELLVPNFETRLQLRAYYNDEGNYVRSQSDLLMQGEDERVELVLPAAIVDPKKDGGEAKGKDRRTVLDTKKDG